MTYMVNHEPLNTTPDLTPAQTAEQQLQEAYRLVGELQAIETRLRKALDTALTTIKGDN